MKQRPKGIQSIDVGFRLLRALEAAGSPMPLKALAAAAGMSSGKAYPYMVSFVRVGMARQDSATGHYGLGPFAVQAGLSCLGQTDVVELARGEFGGVRRATGCGVYLSVWGARGPTIVAKLDGDFQGSLGIRVGHVLPVLITATGKIFLAYLDTTATEEIVREEWRAQDAIAPLRRRRSPDRIVAEVRSRGYAESSLVIAHREGFRGSPRRVNAPFGAFSCPIRSATGELIGALSILVPVEVQEKRGRSQFLPVLMDAAQRISEGLGWREGFPMKHASDTSRVLEIKRAPKAPRSRTAIPPSRRPAPSSK